MNLFEMTSLNCLIWLLFNEANCQVTVSPQAILFINQPAQINCTSTKNPPVWAFNGVNIAGSLFEPCKLLEAGKGLITSVEAPNEKTCNLVISIVGLQHAGNYACADGNTYITPFTAIVTDRLKCESNTTVTSIYNPVSTNCSTIMSFNGKSETQLIWSPASSTSATTSPTLIEYSNNFISSSITTQLNPSNPAASIPPYTCSIRLDKYNYVDSCNTPAINVHFPACRMKFSGNNSANSIYYGTQLICTVSANPPAIITLQYSNGTILDGYVSPSANQLACPITQPDNYTCTAFTTSNLAGSNSISESIELCTLPIDKTFFGVNLYLDAFYLKREFLY